MRRDLVLPLFLAVVLYVALLMSYTWEVMVVTVVCYLLTLPFGARSWHRKYGTFTIGETSNGDVHTSEIDRNI